MALTDTEIRKAKPGTKSYDLRDGGGLYVSVTPPGGKLWRWKYRYEGKEKLMSFGKYPAVTLAAAREKHLEARKLLASGVDPMSLRKSSNSNENSFASITTLWLEHWQEGKTLRHVDTTKRRIASDILPRLGSRALADIKTLDLVAMVKIIESRGAGDIAKRALETTGQIFRYAIAHGYADHNPAGSIRPRDILKSTPKINYARIDARELPELLRKIEVYPGTHVTRLAMKLMALTFVRTGELIEAKWEEFDLDAARWDIPAERMKMKIPHIVPLARQSLELLKLLRDLTGHGEWLFPGDRNPKKSMSNNTILKGLERMGYKGTMTGHGFRGLASTILHEKGYTHEHIELQLAHAPRNAVSAAYNHALYLEPRVNLMQEWADYLEGVQRGGPKLVPMRERVA
jgi:integrase